MEAYNPGGPGLELGFTSYTAGIAIPGTEEDGRKFVISDSGNSWEGKLEIYEVEVDMEWRSRLWTFHKNGKVVWYITFDVATAEYSEIEVPPQYQYFDNSTCLLNTMVALNPMLEEFEQGEGPFPPPYRTPEECERCYMKYRLRQIAKIILDYQIQMDDSVDWVSIMTYLSRIDNTWYNLDELVEWLGLEALVGSSSHVSMFLEENSLYLAKFKRF